MSFYILGCAIAVTRHAVGQPRIRTTCKANNNRAINIGCEYRNLSERSHPIEDGIWGGAGIRLDVGRGFYCAETFELCGILLGIVSGKLSV